MELTRKVCDVKDCKNSYADANRFSVFKDRKADGAGGMENWYWKFDLCVTHQIQLLQDFLDGTQKDTPAKILESHNIEARVE